MSKTRRSALSLVLASSLFLPACTVDAATASALLDSLKQGLASANTPESDSSASSDTTTTADEATTTQQASAPRRLRVTCGTDGQLRIASESDDTDTTAENTEDTTSEETVSDETTEDVTVTEETTEEAEEEVIQEADVIHPVIIEPPAPSPGTRPAPPQPAKRLKLDVSIEAALRQLQQLRPDQRNTRFRELQRQYPQLQQVAPVQITIVNNYGQPTRHMYFEQKPMPAVAARPVMLPPQGQPGYGYAGPRNAGGYNPGYNYNNNQRFQMPGKQPTRPVTGASAAVDLSAYLNLDGLEIPNCNS